MAVLVKTLPQFLQGFFVPVLLLCLAAWAITLYFSLFARRGHV